MNKNYIKIAYALTGLFAVVVLAILIQSYGHEQKMLQAERYLIEAHNCERRGHNDSASLYVIKAYLLYEEKK